MADEFEEVRHLRKLLRQAEAERDTAQEQLAAEVRAHERTRRRIAGPELGNARPSGESVAGGPEHGHAGSRITTDRPHGLFVSTCLCGWESGPRLRLSRSVADVREHIDEAKAAGGPELPPKNACPMCWYEDAVFSPLARMVDDSEGTRDVSDFCVRCENEFEVEDEEEAGSSSTPTPAHQWTCDDCKTQQPDGAPCAACGLTFDELYRRTLEAERLRLMAGSSSPAEKHHENGPSPATLNRALSRRH